MCEANDFDLQSGNLEWLTFCQIGCGLNACFWICNFVCLCIWICCSGCMSATMELCAVDVDDAAAAALRFEWLCVYGVCEGGGAVADEKWMDVSGIMSAEHCVLRYPPYTRVYAAHSDYLIKTWNLLMCQVEFVFFFFVIIKCQYA